MYFRVAFGPAWPKGYEAQVNSSHTDPVRSGSLRAVRITAWTGFYVGLVAALALGFYGVLVALGR